MYTYMYSVYSVYIIYQYMNFMIFITFRVTFVDNCYTSDHATIETYLNIIFYNVADDVCMSTNPIRGRS